MLKQRIITALILAPLAVWSILALPSSLFAMLLGAIIVLSAWEWSRLAGMTSRVSRLGYAMATGVLVVLLYPMIGSDSSALLTLGLLALLWWCAGLVWVIRFPKGDAVWSRNGRVALAGLLILVPAWAMLAGLHSETGPAFVLLLMILVWGADVGAYFAGRRWGRHKLAPRVSPGKTWEGFAGAMAVAGIISFVAVNLLTVPFALWLPFVVLCLLTVAVSVLGDLTESMFKRLAGVKDSGNILPGHGGVLDRIDSLTSAAPVFVLGIMALGVGR